MKKNELYKALKADGAELPPFNVCKKEDLESMYAQIHGEAIATEAEAEPETESEAEEETVPAPVARKMPLLFFTSAGWCNELNTSYFVGMYIPRNEAEYNALRKYADREVAQ